MYARGVLTGLTRGSGKAHLARAALESIAYQSCDVLAAMTADAGVAINSLKVDGGATANRFLMQFQADVLDVCVEKPLITETTALGAAFLAGLACGFWSSQEELKNIRSVEQHFIPSMPAKERMRLRQGWQEAVSRTLSR
jgi:glycerol kinase